MKKKYVIRFKGKVVKNQWARFYFSIMRGDCDYVGHRIIKHGMAVDNPNYDGETGLIIAARWSDAAMVRLLLKHGADPNAKSKWGKTALWWAIKRGKSVMEMTLRNAGAIEMSDGDGINKAPLTQGPL